MGTCDGRFIGVPYYQFSEFETMSAPVRVPFQALLFARIAKPVIYGPARWLQPLDALASPLPSIEVGAVTLSTVASTWDTAYATVRLLPLCSVYSLLDCLIANIEV